MEIRAAGSILGWPKSGSPSPGIISEEILLREGLPDSDPDPKCCQQHVYYQ